MPVRKQSSTSNKPSGEKLHQARITTKTAAQMIGLLKDRPFEVVARGPHQLRDGSFVAEVIAPRNELEKLPKGDWTIEIREPRHIEDPDKQVSKGNRYAKEGAVPHGVGVKK